jgi:hypothetical protein
LTVVISHRGGTAVPIPWPSFDLGQVAGRGQKSERNDFFRRHFVFMLVLVLDEVGAKKNES